MMMPPGKRHDPRQADWFDAPGHDVQDRFDQLTFFDNQRFQYMRMPVTARAGKARPAAAHTIFPGMPKEVPK
jgi:hypothetical protein